jgi:hypothetical protein
MSISGNYPVLEASTTQEEVVVVDQERSIEVKSKGLFRSFSASLISASAASAALVTHDISSQKKILSPISASAPSTPICKRLSNASFTLQHSDGARKRSVLITVGKTHFTYELKTPSQSRLPPDSQKQITNWLQSPETWINKQESGDLERRRQARLAARISYEESDIPKALEDFEHIYKCHWTRMKESEPPASQKMLQIINDFRSANLGKHIATLRKTHPKIKDIRDFGSHKLTSDRDLAIEVSSGDQTEEAHSVSAFNEEFEKEWGSPSSDVFDANVYTMQYLMNASNPQLEEKRLSLQQEASLLRKFRVSDATSWSHFKEMTLARILDPNIRKMKELTFHAIEEKSKELDFLLNREIIKEALCVTVPSERHAEEEPSRNVESILAVIDTPTHEREVGYDFAALIKADDPNSEILAGHKLHEEYKTSYHELEEQRMELSSAISKLHNLQQADDFLVEFNIQIHRLIEYLKKEIAQAKNAHLLDQLKNQLAELTHSQIPLNASLELKTQLMMAFKTRGSIDNEIRELKSHVGELDRLQNLLMKLVHNHDGLESHSSQEGDIIKIMSFITEAGQHEIVVLAKKLGISLQGNVLTLLNMIQDKKEVLRKSLKEMKLLKIPQTEKEYGELWDIAGRLGLEADRMLLKMQEANLTGMQFAHEAHASEGAVAVVVFDMQAGSTEVRTLNQYMQSMREISGYYSSHQAHQEMAHKKILEASKYGDRIITVSKMMMERVLALGIRPPSLSRELDKLETFFKTLVPLRGMGQKAEELQAAVREAAAKAGFSAFLSLNELVDKINEQAEELVATCEAWISEHEQECYEIV